MKNLFYLFLFLVFNPSVVQGQDVPPKPTETVVINEGGKQVKYTKQTYAWGEFYFRNGIQISENDYVKATEGHHQKKELKDTISRTEADAKTLIDSIYNQLMNGGDFKVLAKLYSDDSKSKNNGGEYDGMQRGEFIPEFDDVIYKLKPNEISKPFKTEFGYSIVQLIETDGKVFSIRVITVSFKK
jgi:parvulin-like peptidyl-prolyl isomerase